MQKVRTALTNFCTACSGKGLWITEFYSGHLDMFARGSDGALWHRYFSSGSWHNWESLGGSLPAGADPGADSWGNGRIDVVGRAANNTVTHWWYDGTWHSGEDLGGTIGGTPDIFSRAPGVLDVFGAVSWADGRIDVFGRGTDSTINHWWWG